MQDSVNITLGPFTDRLYGENPSREESQGHPTRRVNLSDCLYEKKS